MQFTHTGYVIGLFTLCKSCRSDLINIYICICIHMYKWLGTPVLEDQLMKCMSCHFWKGHSRLLVQKKLIEKKLMMWKDLLCLVLVLYSMILSNIFCIVISWGYLQSSKVICYRKITFVISVLVVLRKKFCFIKLLIL